jgi:hypothetical protein
MIAQAARVAVVTFVYWSPTMPSQDWNKLHAELAKADAAVLLAGPAAVKTLNAAASGAISAEEARAALKGPPGTDRFTAELVAGVKTAGVVVASPDTEKDEPALQEALRRHADAVRRGDEQAALEALADAHAMQGNSLLAFLKAWGKPGDKIVVLQRLPYTHESAALAAQPGFRVKRVFLPSLPIRFDAAESAERALLKRR